MSDIRSKRRTGGTWESGNEKDGGTKGDQEATHPRNLFVETRGIGDPGRHLAILSPTISAVTQLRRVFINTVLVVGGVVALLCALYVAAFFALTWFAGAPGEAEQTAERAIESEQKITGVTTYASASDGGCAIVTVKLPNSEFAGPHVLLSEQDSGWSVVDLDYKYDTDSISAADCQ